MRCFVVLASQNAGIGDGLTYDAGDLALEPGHLVMVPLRGKPTEAVVLRVGEPEKPEEYAVKKVLSLVSPDPVLTRAQVMLLLWMSTYYACSRRGALRVMLPSPPWKSLVRRETVRYLPGERGDDPRGTKQKEAASFVRARGSADAATLKYKLKASTQTLKSLVEGGFLQEHRGWEEQEHVDPPAAIPDPELTDAQRSARDAIASDKKPSLLFGVTGSGKTEVYASLIARVINEGGQALLLVPEILLTQHSIGRFERLLPKRHIAMLHSRLTPGARRKEWQRIRRGEASLVIGSRSALFAPMERLKLVILDEEHEWTYKNEQTPRYHARDAADMLCAYAGAKLVLGSATPSLESWSRAKAGRYHLARLAERYLGRPVPTVRVVDLATVDFGSLYPFTPTLLAEIDKRLKRGEQTVLFLNRRGMATSLLCMQCRRRVLSPDSALPFTLHRTPDGRPFLLDHISGVTIDIPTGCPTCGSPSLRAVGAGTQKLEDLLATVFPKARVIRADSDTLTFPEQMRELLRRMREKEADILLGTQAVVKGLDLPSVTLAAVMVADVGLSLPHFRAGERVFQLLTQLTGRSGRAQPGEVIIQTFRPDAPEVIAAATHETEKYLEQELAIRVAAGYPPATPMIRLIFLAPDARKRALDAQDKLRKKIAAEGLQTQVLTAPTLFGAGHVWHALIRGKDARRLLPLAEEIDCSIDVDPMDTL
jgi:primosomal protein N' (replication factor Y) (superfamily II helicase)